jgi:hypothetical protein
LEIANKKILAKPLSCDHPVYCGLVDVGDQGEPKQKRYREQESRASQEGAALTPSSVQDIGSRYTFLVD